MSEIPTGWSSFPEHESCSIWDRFYKDFSFRPGVDPAFWPSIRTEKPSIRIDIADLWNPPYDETRWSTLIQKGIDAFTRITAPGEEIIVLDWQHGCYSVDPRKISLAGMLPNEKTPTVLPSFIPDGEYFIFLTADFTNVWFGHPWEKTISIIGADLIKAFEGKTL